MTPKYNAQTVDLDDRKVKIGDSIQIVKKLFDPKIYRWTADTTSYPVFVYLYKHIDRKKGGGDESLAQLKFSFDEKDLMRLKTKNHKYLLNSVQRYWDNGIGAPKGNNELAQKIFKIIENNGIDNYSMGISTTKYGDPSAEAKSISLQIRPNIKLTIEFNGNNNCILSETISKEVDTLSAQYILLYPDSKNLIGKDKIISNVFPSEKEALAKKNEFDYVYMLKNFLPPHSQIVRLNNEELIELPPLH